MFRYTIVLLLALILASEVADRTGITRSPLARIRQTSGQTDEVSTLDVRRETWSFAIQNIRSKPLSSVGLDDRSGLTADVAVVGADGAVVVHNLSLRAWYQGGPLLFAAVSALVISGSSGAVMAVRRSSHLLAAGIIVALVGFSLTSASMSQPYFWLLYVFCWNDLHGWVHRRDVSTRLSSDPRSGPGVVRL